jgi:hypothetical protein
VEGFAGLIRHDEIKLHVPARKQAMTELAKQATYAMYFTIHLPVFAFYQT